MSDRVHVKGIEGVRELLHTLDDIDKRARVLVVTLLQTQRGVGAKIGRDLSKHLYLPVSTIKDRQYVRPLRNPSADNLVTGFKIVGYPIPIKSPGEKQEYKANELRRGVKVKVRRDKGPETFRHAWVSKSGNVKIRKASESDSKQKTLYGPSIPNALAESGTLDQVMDYAADRFLEIAQQQVNRWLPK